MSNACTIATIAKIDTAPINIASEFDIKSSNKRSKDGYAGVSLPPSRQPLWFVPTPLDSVGVIPSNINVITDVSHAQAISTRLNSLPTNIIVLVVSLTALVKFENNVVKKMAQSSDTLVGLLNQISDMLAENAKWLKNDIDVRYKQQEHQLAHQKKISGIVGILIGFFEIGVGIAMAIGTGGAMLPTAIAFIGSIDGIIRAIGGAEMVHGSNKSTYSDMASLGMYYRLGSNNAMVTQTIVDVMLLIATMGTTLISGITQSAMTSLRMLLTQTAEEAATATTRTIAQETAEIEARAVTDRVISEVVELTQTRTVTPVEIEMMEIRQASAARYPVEIEEMALRESTRVTQVEIEMMPLSRQVADNDTLSEASASTLTEELSTTGANTETSELAPETLAEVPTTAVTNTETAADAIRRVIMTSALYANLITMVSGMIATAAEVKKHKTDNKYAQMAGSGILALVVYTIYQTSGLEKQTKKGLGDIGEAILSALFFGGLGVTAGAAGNKAIGELSNTSLSDKLFNSSFILKTREMMNIIQMNATLARIAGSVENLISAVYNMQTTKTQSKLDIEKQANTLLQQAISVLQQEDQTVASNYSDDINKIVKICQEVVQSLLESIDQYASHQAARK